MLLNSAARIESYQATEASVALAKAFLAAAAAAAILELLHQGFQTHHKGLGMFLKVRPGICLNGNTDRETERERRDPT